MNTSDFDYYLPPELIAQAPCKERDSCRLLAMERFSGKLKDCIFRDIGQFLRPGDLLVANETRVLPARLSGRKRTGGTAEVLLLRELGPAPEAGNKTALWQALVRPGKRLKPGSSSVVDFSDAQGQVVLTAEVLGWSGGQDSIGESSFGRQAKDTPPTSARSKGERVVRLSTSLPSLSEALHAAGRLPLPPYIKDYRGEEEMYQTVYSRRESSAAAPTAGLHFTGALIEHLKAFGVQFETIELEVGLDTFRTVEEQDPRTHRIHTEFYSVSSRTAEAIRRTKEAGKRIVAVGTTTVRSLESAAQATGKVREVRREATSLFILPGYEFKAVDALITNFHIPRSTLMMLVSAFATREAIMKAYEHAIEEKYRFLSFGDAMFIY